MASTKDYRPELDGLRAIAIVAVMAFHYLKPVFGGGYIGVDVFFVLSGYLITSILAREVSTTSQIDYAGFVLRRARRLLPGLLALLLAYVLLCPVLWPSLAGPRWFDAALTATYVNNLRQAIRPHETPLGHTWSLAVEAQFYLLWPLVLPALLRLRRTSAILLLLASWLAVGVARFYCQARFGHPGHMFAYFSTPLHASGLLLGAAMALQPPRLRVGLPALGALVLLVIGVRPEIGYPLATPLAEILTALVICDPPRVLQSRPMVHLGKLSYSLYLWHFPLIFGREGDVRALPAIVVAAFGLAMVSYYGVERRFWAQARRPQVAPSPA